MIIAAAGGGGGACVQRVAECLHIGGIALLLFQDPADAAAFEAKLADVQARVTGAIPRRTGGRQTAGARWIS